MRVISRIDIRKCQDITFQQSKQCSDATVFVDLLLFTPTPRARGALVHCASLWLFSLRHLPCDTFPPPSPTAKHTSRIRQFPSPHRPVSVHIGIFHTSTCLIQRLMSTCDCRRVMNQDVSIIPGTHAIIYALIVENPSLLSAGSTFSRT